MPFQLPATTLSQLPAHKKLRGGLLVLALSGAAAAQAQSGAAGGQQPTGAFQRPHLVEGGGDAALVRAVQLGVVYPRRALRENAQGVSQVSFVVAPSGKICLVKTPYSLRPDLDTAVVRAVRQLPQLQPATQHGRPVACSMRAPITFYIDNATRPPKILPLATDSAEVYSTAQWLPLYQGAPGYKRLAADLAAEYLRLSQPGGCAIPRLGVGLVVTVGPSGTLYNVQLMRTDEQQQQAMQAMFGDQIAQKEGTSDEEFDEACLPQLVEAVRHLPRLSPAYVDGRRVAMRLLLTLPKPQL